MSILELRRKKASVIEQMRALHEKSVKEERDFSEEEDAEYNSLKSQIEVLDGKLKRAEELEALRGNDIDQVTTEERLSDVRVTRAEGEDENGKPLKVWRSLGEQLQAVYRAAIPGARNIDPRLSTRAVSGASEGVASDGGFLVQADFANELFMAAHQAGTIASRVRTVSLSAGANSLKMNAIAETSRADGSRWGGVVTYWENEADEFTASKPKFRQMEWKLKKLTALYYATDELLADASALGSVASQAFAEEFKYQLDNVVLRGNGAGKPVGILNSGCLVTQTKEGGQIAATIVYENILKMRSRLWAGSRANAVWLINQDCEPQLSVMKLDVGLGGAPVYIPAGGASAKPYDMLMGIPVIPVEQASTVGTVGDIVLADLSQYLMIEKRGLQSDMSIHVRFIYDESVFRWILRIDGQPLWASELTPANGSSTVSPFVALETRS